MGKSTGGAALIIAIAAALAVGNLLLFALALQHLTAAPAPSFGEAISIIAERAPSYLVYLAAAHLFAGILLAIVYLLFRPASVAPAVAETAAAAPDHTSPALRLLALLQGEGRLVDFLQEEIDDYSDSQVGAAVRAIHAGCRKALRERMRIERIFAADDGAAVEVAAGYDPAAVRLTGNVRGQPPFRGTLQHSGWRAVDAHLPEPAANLDATILAPAEVEIA